MCACVFSLQGVHAPATPLPASADSSSRRVRQFLFVMMRRAVPMRHAAVFRYKSAEMLTEHQLKSTALFYFMIKSLTDDKTDDSFRQEIRSGQLI